MSEVVGEITGFEVHYREHGTSTPDQAKVTVYEVYGVLKNGDRVQMPPLTDIENRCEAGCPRQFTLRGFVRGWREIEVMP